MTRSANTFSAAVRNAVYERYSDGEEFTPGDLYDIASIYGRSYGNISAAISDMRMRGQIEKTGNTIRKPGVRTAYYWRIVPGTNIDHNDRTVAKQEKNSAAKDRQRELTEQERKHTECALRLQTALDTMTRNARHMAARALKAAKRPKMNFVFLSGVANPLNIDASERRFMIVLDDVEPPNAEVRGRPPTETTNGDKYHD